MRVSTTEFFRQATQAITEQQAELSRQQLQVASGKSILQPSDDPVGSAQVIDFTSAGELNAQQTRNAGRAESRLALTEKILAGVTGNLQRVRELAVQAANGTQTNQTRRDLAREIEQRLEQLVSLANTTDANGEYIFAGNKTRTKAFIYNGSNVQYQGDDGQRFVSIGADRQIAVNHPGSRVFMAVPEGNGTFTVSADTGNAGTGVIGTGSVVDAGAFIADNYTVEFTATDQYEVRDGSGGVISTGSYTSGNAISDITGIEFSIQGEPEVGDRFQVRTAGSRDIFSSYRELIDTLRQPVTSDAGAAQLRTSINRTLTGLEQAIGHVVGVRADVGGRLQVIDSQVGLNEERAIQLETARSAIADLDFTEAISKLQIQLTSLQAAQQSFLRIQGLSLFNLIG